MKFKLIGMDIAIIPVTKEKLKGLAELDNYILI